MERPKLYIPPRRKREELQALLDSSDENVVYHALIDAAYYDEDWKWVQRQCLDRLVSPQRLVRCGALYGLQFLGYVRREIEPEVVIPAILALQNDFEVSGLAKEVLDDIYQRFPPH